MGACSVPRGAVGGNALAGGGEHLEEALAQVQAPTRGKDRRHRLPSRYPCVSACARGRVCVSARVFARVCLRVCAFGRVEGVGGEIKVP